MNCQCQVFVLRGGWPEKRQEKEVCLAIPLWSMIQVPPKIWKQTPQHWFKPPFSVTCHRPKPVWELNKSKLLARREEMMSSTPGDNPHTNTEYE